MTLPLLIGGVMSACSDDSNIGAELTPDGPYIELTLDSNDIETRALSGTQTPFTDKERELKNVDIFFYATNANANTDRPIRVYNFTNQKHEDKPKIILSDEDVVDLFGNIDTDGSCVAFAVVNVDEEDYGVAKEDATISQLKAIVAHTASFAEEFDGFAMFTKDPDGDVVEYKAEKRIATGDIKLKNLAAKIDVFVSFKQDIPDGDGQTWNVSMSNDIPTAEVHILNGVTAVGLSGFNKQILTEDDYYSIRSEDEDKYRRGLAKLSSNDSYYEDGKFLWASSAPYYSYPNSWETNPLEKHRTSLILKVDWISSDNVTDVLTTYYNVPIDLKGNQLESNHYYRLKLEINSLGGQHFGEPLELEGEWEVLDWGHALLEADIREIRYLQIAREEFNEKDGNTYTAVLNNTETTVVPYYTSHAVRIKSVNVTYRKIYKAGEDGTGEPITVEFNNYENKANYPGMITAYTLTEDEYAAGQPGVYIDQVNHNVYIRNPLHPLSYSNNRFSFNSNDDPRAIFTIVIEIEHIDDPATNNKITIIQYPPIYAQGSFNPGGDKSGSGFFGTKRDRGFASVNDGVDDFGGINGIEEGWLNSLVGGIFGVDDNPNMYVVTVTNLNTSNAPLHLGDPRMLHTMQSNFDTKQTQIGQWIRGLSRYNLNSYEHLTTSTSDDDNPAAWAVKAPRWLDGQSTYPTTDYLRNYYPTNETPEEQYIYMLAPQFRIASSYGRNRTRTNRNDARKRCATYQENGYPAGRWRLPTVGELQYMAELSQDGIIPQLFRDDEGYWTNNGLYRVENGSVNEITDITDFWLQIWNDRIIDSNLLDPNNAIVIGYTRCVYDEWYWVYKDNNGNKIPDNFSDKSDLKTIFHWGDKPKNNPQEQPDITTEITTD